MENFRDADLPQQLLHRLEQMGFITPTPVQQQAIVPALEGKDVLGTAQTGTGKTGAFGIPMVANLLNNEFGDALVMVPTRELAVQVMQTLKKFIGKSPIPTALVIGGEPMFKQFKQLQMRPRLVVGTPGRIYDHLKRGTLKLNNTGFLVLDEVDRMLDMGFVKQLDAIAPFLPEKRQTLMFSATLPKTIHKISAQYLVDPVRVSVGSTGATATLLKQDNIKLKENEKYPRLLQELQQRQGSVLIFIKTKYNADAMAIKLRKEGVEVEALHGDLRQSRRTRVVEDFRKMRFNVLVATDVAARGLDIPHIEHVINYDLPQNPEDYIHRVGRTARAGAEGQAINFLSPSDGGKWRAISRLINPDQKDEERFEGERSEGGRRSRRGRSEGGFARRSEGGFGRSRRDGDFGSRDANFGSPREEKRSGYEMRKARTEGSVQDEAFAPRQERQERLMHQDRQERPMRQDRPSRDGFAPRRERSGEGFAPRQDRNERPMRSDRQERPERQDRPARQEGFDPMRADRDDVFGSSRRAPEGRGRQEVDNRKERSNFKRDDAKRGAGAPAANAKKNHRKGSNPNRGKKPTNRFAA